MTAGTGYTFGTVDLTDVYSDSSLNTAINIGSGTNGTVVPIISPKGGHGSNAEAELGGHFVMMNTKLEQAEGDDITVANDFREVGIVKDPFAVGTTTVASISTARQTSIVKLSSAPSVAYEIDEKITQSTTGAVGRVVEYDATNLTLFYVQERFSDYGVDANGDATAFSGANVITGASSGAAATPNTTATSATVGSTTVTLSSGYAESELEPNSGDIIYVENRRPISRASDQTEDIKIVVEF